MGTINMIAITHYHLLYAISFVKKQKNKARLYICTDYLNITDEMVDSIRALAIFIKVESFSELEIRDSLFENMRRTRVDRTYFDSVLLKPYSKIFSEIKNDENIYLFNIRQLHYYYIERTCKNVIVLEDGYCSLSQQLETHEFRGRYRLLNDYIGKEWPNLDLLSAEVKYIVTSLKREEILANKKLKKAKNEIIVEDYIDNISSLTKKEKLEISNIFGYKEVKVAKKSLLIITQPLAVFKYCSKLEQYLLYKKMVIDYYEKFDCIYIKPHPKDDLSYAGLIDSENKVFILDKTIPVDIMAFNGLKFEMGITFGSTSLRYLDNIKEKKIIFESNGGTRKQIQKKIKEETKEMKLEIALIKINRDGLAENIKKTINSVLVTDNIRTSSLFLNSEDDAKKNVEKYDYYILDDLNANYSSKFHNQLHSLLQNNSYDLFQFSTTISRKHRTQTIDANLFDLFFQVKMYDKLLSRNAFFEVMNQTRQIDRFLELNRIEHYKLCYQLFVEVQEKADSSIQFGQIELNSLDNITAVARKIRIQFNCYIFFLNKMYDIINSDKKYFDDTRKYLDNLSGDENKELLTIFISKTFYFPKNVLAPVSSKNLLLRFYNKVIRKRF